MDKIRVCALIVTYNRKELLIRNIKSLMSQVYQLDVLIYDNASTDGTYEYLYQNGIFNNEHIFYIKAESNLGGSGGFCNGSKIIYERGYEYAWLMDDDGYCLNDYVLYELVSQINNQDEIINSYVICDIKNRTPTFALNGLKTDEEIQKIAHDGVVEGGNPFNGTLIPCKCFEKIGFPRGDFFIYGDEHEFYLRSNKEGIKWKTVLTSLYYHPVNRNVKEKYFFEHKIICCNQPVWKLYLETRNYTYIDKHYSKYNCIIKNAISLLIKVFNSDDKKIKRLKYGLIGIMDGVSGNFKRPIMFDE